MNEWLLSLCQNKVLTFKDFPDGAPNHPSCPFCPFHGLQVSSQLAHTRPFPTFKPSSCCSLSLTALPYAQRVHDGGNLGRWPISFPTTRPCSGEFYNRNPLTGLLSFLTPLFLKLAPTHPGLCLNKRTLPLSLGVLGSLAEEIRARVLVS